MNPRIMNKIIIKREIMAKISELSSVRISIAVNMRNKNDNTRIDIMLNFGKAFRESRVFLLDLQ